MSTLKEAVESGRRWRYKAWGAFYGPGIDGTNEYFSLRVDHAASSDFEIEPEPEKPREWIVHFRRGEISEFAGVGQWTSGECKEHFHVRVHDADACDRLHSK